MSTWDSEGIGGTRGPQGLGSNPTSSSAVPPLDRLLSSQTFMSLLCKVGMTPLDDKIKTMLQVQERREVEDGGRQYGAAALNLCLGCCASVNADRKAAEGGPGVCAPATHVGDPDGVLRLLPTWETRTEFWAPGCSLDQPHRGHLGSQSVNGRFSLFLMLCLLNK